MANIKLDCSGITAFNGSNNIWLVANVDKSYSVKISISGVVSEISMC